jgi:hypothetical protein
MEIVTLNMTGRLRFTARVVLLVICVVPLWPATNHSVPVGVEPKTKSALVVISENIPVTNSSVVNKKFSSLHLDVAPDSPLSDFNFSVGCNHFGIRKFLCPIRRRLRNSSLIFRKHEIAKDGGYFGGGAPFVNARKVKDGADGLSSFNDDVGTFRIYSGSGRILGKTNQNLLDADRPSHGRPLHSESSGAV